MDAGEWIEAFIRGFICILGIIGNNWLAIISFPSKMSQIQTRKALFFNLAISNLITNYFVDLPDAIADFAGKWFMSRTYCAIFQFCSDLSATSSIISTMLITVYWHQKLVGSLSRLTAPVRLDNLRLVAALLAAGWGIALVFSVPHFYFVSLGMANDSSDDCVESFPSSVARQTYEAMYLTLANAVPIAGMVFSSIRIVIALLRHQARITAMNSEAHGSMANAQANKDEESESRTRYGIDSNNRKGTRPVDAPGCPLTPCNIQMQVHNQTQSDALSALECSKDLSTSNLSAHPPDHARDTLQRWSKEAPSRLPPPRPNKTTTSPSNQVRAAKSVVAVATVFLVCWLTHLLLRITNNVHESSLLVEVASYIAASYTCIIPYIFLYGLKKLSCPCRR